MRFNATQFPSALRELRIIVWSVIPFFMLAVGYLMWRNSVKDELIAKLLTERPVMVVPGSVPGVYISGLSMTNLRGAARYLTSLPTNFTDRNVLDRISEFERFVAPEFLDANYKNTLTLVKEVVAQSQSRYFAVEQPTETLDRNPQGDFVYAVQGKRSILSGSLLLAQDDAVAKMVFRLSTPSEKNQYGIAILDFNIVLKAKAAP